MVAGMIEAILAAKGGSICAGDHERRAVVADALAATVTRPK